MRITAKNHDMTVESVVSTTIRRNGKSYPALKFIFAEEVTTEDIVALTSGNIFVGENAHEGYTTLDEISITVGKITTAEQQRDEIESELTATKAEHEEYRGTVNTILPVLDDETALSVKTIFPEWKINKTYTTGERFIYSGELYKVVQNHTSQADWTPDAVASLYEVINVTNKGTPEDPIPYNGNMVLEEGKYYVQDGVIYLCNRNSENPVYNALSELVNLYVVEYTV
jgi:hypothetical protein